jgi:homoserine O-acetyltransferase
MEFIKSNPDGLKFYLNDSKFYFKSGESISQLVLAFEEYGHFNENKSNVILIHHALSTHSHVASHELNKNKGWWDNIVGKGKAIDTEKYYVICINNLGSCFGSSGPSVINPEENFLYGSDFPEVSFEDVVHSQKFLLDFLKIKKLYAIVGPSLGGMISLQFSILYPDFVERLLSISSSARTTPANNANRAIQREIIKLDPNWKNGKYIQNPLKGLKAARKLGILTYRSVEEFNERFDAESSANISGEEKDSVTKVESYLEYNAAKFAKGFDTNSYLTILRMMDIYDVRSELTKLKAHTLIISVDTDRLFPHEQQREIYTELEKLGKPVRYIIHESKFGHDTFLIETDTIGNYIKEFLEKRIDNE